ncbi:MAG: insulinase family protein [Planctomycetota bacterium]
MSGTKMPPVRHRAGERLHGFTIEQVTPIEDVRAVAYEAVHDATGARLLHLHAEDPENLLAIVFRTPPPDSSGVPHILEHSVLAGSERFPVRDAFNELARGSLATFINAMTWPDKTVYPVASAVRADYFNLATVYLDVTLHPRLSEATFRQEGHHLELANPDDLDSELVVSGVVYNEMKGEYSTADRLTFQRLQEALYPDNCYGRSSGGDPEVIPDLSYAAFREFHRRYYSLSNARIFLYGDIPTAEQLAFLARELAYHGPPVRVEVDSTIADQPVWDRPRRLESEYPAAAGESRAGKTVVNVAWMTAPTASPNTTILLRVLHQAILGTAAGPLRRALLESGLGEDVSPESGFETEYKQSIFVAGLRGTEGDRAEAIERLVLDTLERLAATGIDEELLRGAFHQFEFASKEIGSHYPVRLLVRASQTWTYDADPKVGLALSSAIETVRRRWEGNPLLFAETIRTWLLDNPHRLLAISRPSESLVEARESALRARMAARRRNLDRAEVERIRDEARALAAAQETPDPPEALATLPRLRLADIPRDLRTVPTRITRTEGVTVLEHEIFTGGITYLHLAFDVAPVAEALHPLLPLLGLLTTGMGAAGLSYDEMARRKSLFTGGVSAGLSAQRRLGDRRTIQRLTIGGRALDRHVDELGAILRDLLTASDLTDEKRATDLLLESRNDARAGVLPAGHGHARLLAAAAQDLASFREEQYSGFTQIRFLDEAAKSRAERLPELLEAVAAERPRLFVRAGLVVDVVADAAGLAAARSALPPLFAALPAGEPGVPVEHTNLGAARLGFAFASQVNYVAQVSPAPALTDPLAPAVAVLARLLSDVYLYERVRLQGGAYGGFCTYDPLGGQFATISYRDPHLCRTLGVFDDLASAVRASARIDERSVERAIIATVGAFDQILSPAAQGAAALRRHLSGVTDELRGRYRAGLLAVTPADLLDEALPAIEQDFARASRAVVGARETIEAANAALAAPFPIVSLE